MTGYLARRLTASLPTLLGISLVAFTILDLLPQDPMRIASGTEAPSAEAAAHLRRDLPEQPAAVVRYLAWVADLARGDLGRSTRDGRPVRDVLAEALPWTLALNAAALALIYGLGVPFGLLTASRAGSRFDRAGGAILIVMYALPSFAAGLLLQHWLAVRWRLLPLHGPPDGGSPGGAQPHAGALIAHLAMPAVCLALGGGAFVARYARSAFRSAFGREFLAAARAKGMSRARLMAHAAAWAAVPLVTLLATLLPGLVGGSVVIEQVFSWPGVGRLYLSAIEGRDAPVVLGLTLLSAAAVFATGLILDLLYVLADPRIRTRFERSADGGR